MGLPSLPLPRVLAGQRRGHFQGQVTQGDYFTLGGHRFPLGREGVFLWRCAGGCHGREMVSCGREVVCLRDLALAVDSSVGKIAEVDGHFWVIYKEFIGLIAFHEYRFLLYLKGSFFKRSFQICLFSLCLYACFFLCLFVECVACLLV